MNYTKHFEISSKCSLRDFFNQESSLQGLDLEELLHFGAIYLNKSRAKLSADSLLSKGDYLRVHCKPKRFCVPENIQELILYKNEDFIVAQKPSMIPSLPGLDNQIENLQFQLSSVLNKSLYSVHQLDIETTGLIAFALSKENASIFGKLFSDRKVKKSYRLLCRKELETGPLLHYMEKSNYSPKRLFHKETSQFSLKCILDILSCHKVNTTDSFLNNSLLYQEPSLPNESVYECKVNLKTGRTHQIRAQISAVSEGILGDSIYGIESSFPVFALQAYRLWFNFKGRTYEFEIPTEGRL
jgi:23S rRNA pseudouridine1911/1915/1917 synthase